MTGRAGNALTRRCRIWRHQCTQTVLKEVGHKTRSAAKPLAAQPLGPEAQGWAVTPVYCVGDGGGSRAGHDGRGPEAPGPAAASIIGGAQGLARLFNRRRTALGRRTLWPAGLWSERTQPAGAGERSGEVTRTTRAAGGEGGAHQAWSSGPRWTWREAPDTAKPCWVGRRSAEWAPRRGGEFAGGRCDLGKLADVRGWNNRVRREFKPSWRSES